MAELQSLRSLLDSKFIQGLPEELRCPICLDLLRDPHLADCCGKHFCHSCLSKAHQKKGPVCPICQQRYTSVRDPNVVRRINALRVECSNKVHGCDWVGEYKYFDKHVRVTCNYMMSLCVLGCGQHIPRKHQEKHNHFMCPYRSYKCQYCGKYSNTYKDVEENHWPVCDEFPVPCPNDCPTGSVPRGRVMDHLRKECQMRQQLTRERLRSTDLTDENAQLKTKIQKLKNEVESTNELSAQLYARIQQLEYELSSQGEHNRQLLAINRELEQQVKLHEEKEQETQSRSKKDKEQVASKRQSLLHDPNLMLQWTQCSSLPEVLCEASAVLCGGYVYTGGGICQRRSASDNECTVFKYDYHRDSWSKLPTARRRRFTLVSFQDRLVAVGGKALEGDYLKTLIEWDDTHGTWKESFPPMNSVRKGAAAVGYGDHIAVAGGSNESGPLSSVEVFSNNTRQWYLAKSLPLALSKVTSALLRDQWYLIGGKEKTACGISIDSLVCRATSITGFEDEDAKWESLADTPCELSTAAAFGECLLAIGGKTSTVHAYLDSRHYWIPVTDPHPLATLYSAATVAISPDELLVIGGNKGFTRYEYVHKATLA